MEPTADGKQKDIVRRALRFTGYVLQGTEEQIDGVILAVERGAYVQIENMYVKTLPLIEDEYGFTVKDDE